MTVNEPMLKDPVSLGAIALIHNKGNSSRALAELMAQATYMCSFIKEEGFTNETVLKMFDAISKSSRAALVEILNKRKEV